MFETARGIALQNDLRITFPELVFAVLSYEGAFWCPATSQVASSFSGIVDDVQVSCHSEPACRELVHHPTNWYLVSPIWHCQNSQFENVRATKVHNQIRCRVCNFIWMLRQFVLKCCSRPTWFKDIECPVPMSFLHLCARWGDIIFGLDIEIIRKHGDTNFITKHSFYHL